MRAQHFCGTDFQRPQESGFLTDIATVLFFSSSSAWSGYKFLDSHSIHPWEKLVENTDGPSHHTHSPPLQAQHSRSQQLPSVHAHRELHSVADGLSLAPELERVMPDACCPSSSPTAKQQSCGKVGRGLQPCRALAPHPSCAPHGAALRLTSLECPLSRAGFLLRQL